MEMESIIDVSGLPEVEFIDGIRINDINEKLLHGKKKDPAICVVFAPPLGLEPRTL